MTIFPARFFYYEMETLTPSICQKYGGLWIITGLLLTAILRGWIGCLKGDTAAPGFCGDDIFPGQKQAGCARNVLFCCLFRYAGQHSGNEMPPLQVWTDGRSNTHPSPRIVTQIFMDRHSAP